MPEQARDSRRWGQQLQNATERVEEDLKRVVTYINNEVVPDIRRNGSQALRSAAAELHKLAQRMDDQNRTATTSSYTAKDPDRPR